MERPKRRITLKGMMIAVAVCALGLALVPEGLPQIAIPIPLATLFAVYFPRFLPIPATLFLSYLALIELALGGIPAWLYLPPTIAIVGRLWPRRPSDRHPRGRRIAASAVCVLVAALYFLPWTTRKPFLAALDGIKPGMTVEEVRRRMAGHILPGPDGEYGSGGVMYFRHSTETYLNADIGAVYFRDGKVVSVEFLPD